MNPIFGLMFKLHSKPIMFEWDKPGIRAIHSFFCKTFVAIWCVGDTVVETEVIKPFRWNVVPTKEFDRLVEIPLKKYHELCCN